MGVISPGHKVVEDRRVITEGHLDGYSIGLDLGKSQDFTAICVAEVSLCERQRWQRLQFEPLAQIVQRRVTWRYRIRNVHRYPRGTSYPDIARSVRNVMGQLPAAPVPPALFVDRTGVGAPVVDTMREMGLALVGVSITGGAKVNKPNPREANVPKSVLASALDIAFAEDRLELTSQATASEALKSELQGFRVKKTAHGNETMEAWREGIHDDLVLATALAVWGGEQRIRPRPPRQWDMGR